MTQLKKETCQSTCGGHETIWEQNYSWQYLKIKLKSLADSNQPDLGSIFWGWEQKKIV